MGYFRTAVLLAGMTALFLTIGFLLGGEGGLLIALVFAGAMNLFTYWKSDKMVLAMYGAKQVSRTDAPELYDIVERLARNADLPMPKVYVMENPQPNAFATGRNPENAAVAATTGLLERLSADEVAGVMAHELAHVKNRDTLIMTITATIAGAIGMIANFALFFGNNRNNPMGIVGTLLVMFLAPVAAMLVQMAISRSREYEADRIGAEIYGDPRPLATALEKLQRGAAQIDNIAAENNPATAHLFIVNPLHKHNVDQLFSTHPNMENRIARLLAMRPSGPGGFTMSSPAPRKGGTRGSVPDSGRRSRP